MAQNLYETMFVLKPTLTPEETQARIAFIKDVITSQGGEIAAVEDWGSRKLAYKVEKFDRGYYYVSYFKAEGKSILELERMRTIGKAVDLKSLKPGDLIFFKINTSHVGIYIGNNKFIHAPSTGRSVAVDNLMSSFFQDRVLGARRVIEE